MIQPVSAHLSRSCVVCLAATLVWALTGAEGSAGWHHHYRQGCSACGANCGSSGGSHGAHRCWRCRHHASHGSCGGSSGGSSGGSAGGSSGGEAARAVDAPKEKDAKKTAAVGVPADGVMIVVEVPEDAILLVNGRETNLSGAIRNFVSAGLADDQQYDYTISMRVTREGKVEEQTRTVSVSGGQRHVVAFDAPAPRAFEDSMAVNTALTLRVPEGAKVWIEGQPTAKEGAVREFRTSALRAGETWEGYEVKVATMVDGREWTETKRITLVGGNDISLTIDPAANLATMTADGEPVAAPAAGAAPLDSTAAVQ